MVLNCMSLPIDALVKSLAKRHHHGSTGMKPIQTELRTDKAKVHIPHFVLNSYTPRALPSSRITTLAMSCT